MHINYIVCHNDQHLMTDYRGGLNVRSRLVRWWSTCGHVNGSCVTTYLEDNDSNYYVEEDSFRQINRHPKGDLYRDDNFDRSILCPIRSNKQEERKRIY